MFLESLLRLIKKDGKIVYIDPCDISRIESEFTVAAVDGSGGCTITFRSDRGDTENLSEIEVGESADEVVEGIEELLERERERIRKERKERKDENP
jgi:hypothetical protein